MSAAILMYHRVADDPGDPFMLCVEPQRFARQLRRLRDRTDVVSLTELVSRRPIRHARPQVAITFDDGYADNLWNALPSIEACELPVTIFVTSRAIGETAGFWWDRLAGALLGRQEIHLRLEIAGRPLQIRLRGESGGLRALQILHRRLRPLPPHEIDLLIGEIEDQLGGYRPRTPSPAMLTKEELLHLAKHPLVDIGAHTTRHALLRSQPAAEQSDTIAQSKVDLEEMTGEPVIHFAYPFGGLDSFAASTVKAVRANGFRSACSTLDGSLHALSNRYYLPRRMVQDWELADFDDRLEAWGISK